jgi:hypothetical protein
MFEIAADPSKAIAGTESLRDQAGQAVAKTDAAYKNHMALSDQMTRQALSNFATMGAASKDWGGVTLGVLGQVTEQMMQQMETDQKVSVTHALTQAAMAESTILGVKGTAIVKAAYETAESIAAFARLDFRGGTLHALAAAEYAALAATAGSSSSGLSKSAVQSSSSASASSGSSSASAASPAPPLAPGAQAPAASGNVTVMVVGDTGAAQWMAGVLNKGVATKSVRLVSSHTMRPAPAVRSG